MEKGVGITLNFSPVLRNESCKKCLVRAYWFMVFITGPGWATVIVVDRSNQAGWGGKKEDSGTTGVHLVCGLVGNWEKAGSVASRI